MKFFWNVNIDSRTCKTSKCCWQFVKRNAVFASIGNYFRPWLNPWTTLIIAPLLLMNVVRKKHERRWHHLHCLTLTQAEHSHTKPVHSREKYVRLISLTHFIGFYCDMFEEFIFCHFYKFNWALWRLIKFVCIVVLHSPIYFLLSICMKRKTLARFLV